MQDSNNIKIFLSGKYRYVDYNIFISSFVKTNFFVKDIICIERFMFNVLKIQEEDKERILNSFKEEIKKTEEDLINNQEDKDYFDKLNNYLHHVGFGLLDKTTMEIVLNHLKVSDFNRNKILKEYLKVV